MFEHVKWYGGDPILSLMDAYKEDPRPDKINLSIGLYYNDAGVVQTLQSVETARLRYMKDLHGASMYLPMGGLVGYCEEVKALLFGLDSPVLVNDQVATIQTLGGSGALKVGADFLKRWFPQSQVWVSDPTWENHVSIFQGAGFPVFKYPYINEVNGAFDFDAMFNCISSFEPRTIVLLHPCCHNPTGFDLTEKQWDQLIAMMKDHDLIPFFDLAYQGFGRGLVEDTYVLRAMVQNQMFFLVGNSFSKIFSLYGERVGGLSVVCDDNKIKKTVLGQLQATVRRNYSSPPTFGAQLVYEVLKNDELKKMWINEIDEMRLRMYRMREKLYATILQMGGTPDRYQFLLEQKGMFSYTSYQKSQVAQLREEDAIYMVDNGRMCIAGLNHGNIESVARAMLSVDHVE